MSLLYLKALEKQMGELQILGTVKNWALAFIRLG